MITEQYVSLDTAKLLKEKGFNEPTLFNYGETDDQFCGDGVTWSTNEELDEYYERCHEKFGWINLEYSAPTQAVALAWLRQRHFVVVIEPYSFGLNYDCTSWKYTIWADDNAEESNALFDTYEEATEEAIKHALNQL